MIEHVYELTKDAAILLIRTSGMNIPLIRKLMPKIIAADICGVQPMNGPFGLVSIFRARYAGAHPSTNTTSIPSGMGDQLDQGTEDAQLRGHGVRSSDPEGTIPDDEGPCDKEPDVQ